MPRLPADTFNLQCRISSDINAQLLMILGEQGPRGLRYRYGVLGVLVAKLLEMWLAEFGKAENKIEFLTSWGIAPPAPAGAPEEDTPDE